MNQSIINALKLLDFFSEDQPEFSLGEIYRKTNMSKPTVYRLLSSLEYCGFLIKVKRSEQDVRYKLGLKLLELGHIVSEQLELRKIALPYMKELRDEINEIVLLGVLDGEQATYIEKLDSSQAVRLYTRIGKSTPLYIGSGPKLLFAYLPEEERNKILDKLILQPLTENTITDKGKLIKELEQIRKLGFAVSNGEQNMDTIGISFPIRDHTGSVAAALTMSGPSSRFNSEREAFIKEKLKTTADQISRDLGFVTTKVKNILL
jgi:DNA-binding IclR family transcriptional regulator